MTEDEETLRATRETLAEKRVKEYLDDMEKLGFSRLLAAEYAGKIQEEEK